MMTFYIYYYARVGFYIVSLLYEMWSLGNNTFYGKTINYDINSARLFALLCWKPLGAEAHLTVPAVFYGLWV